MTDKTTLRAEAKARISELTEDYISVSDRKIAESFAAMPELRSAGTVFAYCSTGRETDTSAIISAVLGAGRRVALPVTCGRGKMYFAAYSGNTAELEPGMYGILQPKQGLELLVPERDDVIIVPALMFDSRGFRLGHGGGYYDRFLAGGLALSVGLCRERLIYSGELPTDGYDIPVDCLVTENRTTRLVKSPAEGQ